MWSKERFSIISTTTVSNGASAGGGSALAPTGRAPSANAVAPTGNVRNRRRGILAAIVHPQADQAVDTPNVWPSQHREPIGSARFRRSRPTTEHENLRSSFSDEVMLRNAIRSLKKTTIDGRNHSQR